MMKRRRRFPWKVKETLTCGTEITMVFLRKKIILKNKQKINMKIIFVDDNFFGQNLRMLLQYLTGLKERLVHRIEFDRSITMPLAVLCKRAPLVFIVSDILFLSGNND
mmetsp:Transcript_34883/g.35064  ORF Transcript_34883/g.35064 Transcript_34883/m.35064 type:complete len:108 (-) Transcript_34883:20-343(-)